MGIEYVIDEWDLKVMDHAALCCSGNVLAGGLGSGRVREALIAAPLVDRAETVEVSAEFIAEVMPGLTQTAPAAVGMVEEAPIGEEPIEVAPAEDLYPILEADIRARVAEAADAEEPVAVLLQDWDMGDGAYNDPQYRADILRLFPTEGRVVTISMASSPVFTLPGFRTSLVMEGPTLRLFISDRWDPDNGIGGRDPHEGLVRRPGWGWVDPRTGRPPVAVIGPEQGIIDVDVEADPAGPVEVAP